MKSEKLVLVCSRCNSDLYITLASGPLRIECPSCMGKVDAAENILAHIREMLERIK